MATTQVSTTTKKKTGIASYLANEKVKAQVTSLVGEKATPTFVSSIVSAVQTNPALSECTNASILSSALLGESLKLSPSPQLGNYYLVPYKNRGTSEAQFQLGYKGMIQLAIRSGQYRKIVASEVKEGECGGFNPITEEFTLTPIMDIVEREKRPTIGYYAMLELTNGFRKEIFWTKEQMESHALKYSKGYAKKSGYTFWEKDFDAMAKKTMLRQLISKWGVMSVEMQTAYQADMSVVREDGSYDYVDGTETDVKEEVAETVAENSGTEEFIDATATEVK
jgi:recombination protein RecT